VEEGIAPVCKISDVGKLYSAKTTPHMFVVNPAGVLIYAGAIDSKATSRPSRPAVLSR
jgi:hypothetical protein